MIFLLYYILSRIIFMLHAYGTRRIFWNTKNWDDYPRMAFGTSWIPLWGDAVFLAGLSCHFFNFCSLLVGKAEEFLNKAG